MSPSTGRIDGSQANTTCSAVVRLIETISRKPSASTTPNDSTRLRSHAQGPDSCLASLWKIRLSAVCRSANTAVAPMKRSTVLHSQANEPTTGRRERQSGGWGHRVEVGGDLGG